MAHLALLDVTSDLDDIVSVVNEFVGGGESVGESLEMAMKGVGQRLLLSELLQLC